MAHLRGNIDGVPFLLEYYSASTWNQATETLDALEVNEPCLVSRSVHGDQWTIVLMVPEFGPVLILR